jgi:hypothetical protein
LMQILVPGFPRIFSMVNPKQGHRLALPTVCARGYFSGVCAVVKNWKGNVAQALDCGGSSWQGPGATGCPSELLRVKSPDHKIIRD